MKLSLVVPAYNEEKAIEKVLDEALGYVDEVIVVDDGSKDNTAKIARSFIKEHKKSDNKNKEIKLISHAINLGKAAALNTGVKNSSGEVVIFTDADDTYPCRHVPELIKEIENGADLVIGSRFLPKPPKNMSFSHVFGNKLFSSLVSYISSTNITDSQSGMRAFRKEIFPQIDVRAKSLEYEPKATARAAKLGYKIKEIPIAYRKRIGESKMHGLKDGFKILFSLMSVAYGETTLLARMIMIPSFLLALIGIIIAGFLIKDYLMIGIVKRPYYPLIAALSLIVSTQLFSLGLIIDNVAKKLSRMEETIRRKQ